MLLKLGIVAAVGYGIYRYATTNPNMAKAYSGGESGIGAMDPHDHDSRYSPPNELSGVPGVGSTNMHEKARQPSHLG